MSFSYRDKPRLSERLRGKSGDDLINELKNHLDQERKMFFDTAPNWGSVHPSGSFSSRTGFPFDDEMMPRSGRQDIRAHLDDLAQRHPEFAEQLRCPPWAGEMSGSPSHTGTWGQNRRGSNDGEPHTQARSSSSGSNVATEPSTTSPKPEDNRGRNPFPQQGEPGRDDGGNRGQRSMSAPPDARNQHPPEPQNQPQQMPQPQRYVSRVNITPGKPPVAPQKPQSPQQSSSNVRHIPIFVEGRDEPILPKNLVSEDPPPEQVFSQRIPPQPQQAFTKPQTYTSHHQFQPQQRFYSPQQSARTEYTRPQQNVSQQNVPQSKPETIFSQQNSAPTMQPPTAQQPKETPKTSQPPKPQQPNPQQPNDPIHRVQAIQKDVANLQRMVENFAGTSRKDKQYIYLDEMLTRNLLKLDDIDTEGKENVRQARKEAIRSIQKCISILESRVPAPEEQNEVADSDEIAGMQSVDGGDTTEQKEENQTEKMEADTVEPEPAVLENVSESMESDIRETDKHTEKMDVEHSVPVQQSEKESKQIESQSSPAVTETNKNENKGNGQTSDTQLTMDVVVDPEAQVKEAANQVTSENLSEKGVKNDMEVEPPASVQTDTVQMEAEALPHKDETVKAEVELQNEDVKEPHLPQTVKEAAVAEETKVLENRVSATTGISKETEPKTGDDTTAMQVEPVPAESEITNPPITEEPTEKQPESGKENVSSEQTSDKNPKQEVDTKKKKTGKKVKSPSKKPPKQGSNSKSDTVSGAEEAQKS